jgi:hypothetical protein
MSENKLDRIEDKLDKLSDKIASIDVTLAKQEVSLGIHMKRSDSLEELVSQHRIATNLRLEVVETPIRFLKSIAKVGGWIASIGGAVLVIMKLIHRL